MNDILFWLASLAYVMAPAYVANMAPPFTRYWRGWNPPISRRWLGDHKTVVGFAAGVAAGVLTAWVQSRLPGPRGTWASADWLAVGLALGFGAMAGDSVKSFAKRRVGIAPGGRWMPADQLDYVTGALLLGWPWLRLDGGDAVAILVMTFAGTLGVNRLAFRLGVKETAW